MHHFFLSYSALSTFASKYRKPITFESSYACTCMCQNSHFWVYHYYQLKYKIVTNLKYRKRSIWTWVRGVIIKALHHRRWYFKQVLSTGWRSKYTNFQRGVSVRKIKTADMKPTKAWREWIQLKLWWCWYFKRIVNI